MKEKIEELPWRSVKIEPGTQKTFDAASHAVFINSQYTLLKEFGEDRLHFPEGLMKALGEMADLETGALVERKRSTLTEQLKAKDAERDKALRYIKLRNFRYIRHQGYDVESGNIDSMLMDAERLKKEIGTLHLEESFDCLREANKAYERLVKERDAERLANNRPSMRNLRPRADKLYELACQYVQASYLFAQTAEERNKIEELVARLNQRVRNIKTSHRKSASQRRRRGKEDEAAEGA